MISHRKSLKLKVSYLWPGAWISSLHRVVIQLAEAETADFLQEIIKFRWQSKASEAARLNPRVGELPRMPYFLDEKEIRSLLKLAHK